MFASTPKYLYPDSTFTAVLPNIDVKLAPNDIDLSWDPPIPENPPIPRVFPYFNPNCIPRKYKIKDIKPLDCIIFSGGNDICYPPSSFDPSTECRKLAVVGSCTLDEQKITFRLKVNYLGVSFTSSQLSGLISISTVGCKNRVLQYNTLIYPNINLKVSEPNIGILTI